MTSCGCYISVAPVPTGAVSENSNNQSIPGLSISISNHDQRRSALTLKSERDGNRRWNDSGGRVGPRAGLRLKH